MAATSLKECAEAEVFRVLLEHQPHPEVQGTPALRLHKRIGALRTLLGEAPLPVREVSIRFPP